MFKKSLTIALLLFFSLNVNAQNTVFDAYNHIIIPLQFDFQKSENEDQLNSLLRHLFREDGFNAFMDKELLPFEFQEQPCKGLRVNLEHSLGKIETTATINIYDCENKIVFSCDGTSYDKDFKDAHQAAIRDAFRKIESANYSLKPNVGETMATEKKSLTKEERKELRKQEVREQSDLYLVNGEKQYFFPVGDKLHVYHFNAYDILAKLTPITNDSYIYNSDEIDGVITIKENGDLELEYREITSKTTQKLQFERIKKAE